ncbi:FRIGIDA-like protein 3 [Forsythia ovata]|uniref:FRIGIDA-like protein n=1 Tax=Forsythia ovata TaxID=205694 RepID=A0ABD1UTI5_9LAMI
MGKMDLANVANTVTILIQQLGKAIHGLKSHKHAAIDEAQLKEIEEHFRRLEMLLLDNLLELEIREKAFKEEESTAVMFIESRKEDVAAKEQDLLDQIQELKDAAVAAITDARATHQLEPLESVDAGENKDQVSSSLGDTNALHTGPEVKSSYKNGENAEGLSCEVKPQPEIIQLCERMDAKGLLHFVMENKKYIPSLCEQLSLALESVNAPGRLVLASLEGFYPPNENKQKDEKIDAALLGKHRSCIIIMEAMATLLAKADLGAEHLLNPEIKQHAKAIADEWKPKLASTVIDAANGNSLEAEAFLNLLATFGIASEFDEDELCRLVLAVAHHWQGPKLCQSLGLTNKMPVIVEALIKNGKQLDATRYIHAFQLDESFPLVPLLKEYLNDFEGNIQIKEDEIGTATGKKKDSNAQEREALLSVIQCIQAYRLEGEYPIGPLQRRVSQLEKSKHPRKRFRESRRHRKFKKPFYGFSAPAAPTVFGGRASYAGIPGSYAHNTAPSPYNYHGAAQSAYPQQTYDQRLYQYPKEDGVPGTSYNAGTLSFGNYIGDGFQPPNQPNL